MMGDISDFKQTEAGYQRLYEELECLVCHEGKGVNTARECSHACWPSSRKPPITSP